MRFAPVILLAAGLVAQEPDPVFEAVSIRAVPKDAQPLLRDIDFSPVLPGGQYVDSRTTLWSMMAYAYRVKDASNRLVGLPNWGRERAFSVSAKAGNAYPRLSPAENDRQVRLMMRAMLGERFRLRAHVETREEPVYRVEIAKGGLKLQEVDAPVPPAKAGLVGVALGDSGGRLIGKKSTIAGLIAGLAPHLKAPLVDGTGLNGYYDFDIRWTAPEPPDGHVPANMFGPDGAALVISVLQERFGLKLVKTTGPVEYCVVDRVEMPTEN